MNAMLKEEPAHFPAKPGCDGVGTLERSSALSRKGAGPLDSSRRGILHLRSKAPAPVRTRAPSRRYAVRGRERNGLYASVAPGVPRLPVCVNPRSVVTGDGAVVKDGPCALISPRLRTARSRGLFGCPAISPDGRARWPARRPSPGRTVRRPLASTSARPLEGTDARRIRSGHQIVAPSGSSRAER